MLNKDIKIFKCKAEMKNPVQKNCLPFDHNIGIKPYNLLHNFISASGGLN